MATNRIHAKGPFRHIEAVVITATITPGMLCEINSAGKVIRQVGEGEQVEAMVAVEDALQGNIITDAYAVADRAMLNIYQKGSEAFVFLKAGESVAIGAYLSAGGAGVLIAEGTVASGTTANRIAVALQTLDISASGAVATLLKVRFI